MTSAKCFLSPTNGRKTPLHPSSSHLFVFTSSFLSENHFRALLLLLLPSSSFCVSVLHASKPISTSFFLISSLLSSVPSLCLLLFILSLSLSNLSPVLLLFCPPSLVLCLRPHHFLSSQTLPPHSTGAPSALRPPEGVVTRVGGRCSALV